MPANVGVAAFVFGIVLLLAALVGKDLEVAAIKLPALSRPARIVAAIAGVALVYIGLFDPFRPVAAPQATPASASPTAAPPAQATAPAGGQAALDALTTVEEIEPLLLQANIRLSEPEDEERTRSYFTGPESAYHKLAVASLKVVGERRFKLPINLDIVDKWYTQAAGSGYAERGPLDLEKVKQALLDAHNDYYGDDASALDALLEPRG